MSVEIEELLIRWHQNRLKRPPLILAIVALVTCELNNKCAFSNLRSLQQGVLMTDIEQS